MRIELAGPVTGSPISVDEMRSRLNFVQSGNRFTKQLILRNADEIQVYLRDRGYYNAVVEPVEQLRPARPPRDRHLPGDAWRPGQS